MSDLKLENAAMAPRRWNELFIAIRETASQMPVTLMQCCVLEQLELSMIRFRWHGPDKFFIYSVSSPLYDHLVLVYGEFLFI